MKHLHYLRAPCKRGRGEKGKLNTLNTKQTKTKWLPGGCVAGWPSHRRTFWAAGGNNLGAAGRRNTGGRWAATHCLGRGRQQSRAAGGETAGRRTTHLAAGGEHRGPLGGETQGGRWAARIRPLGGDTLRPLVATHLAAGGKNHRAAVRRLTGPSAGVSRLLGGRFRAASRRSRGGRTRASRRPLAGCWAAKYGRLGGR